MSKTSTLVTWLDIYYVIYFTILISYVDFIVITFSNDLIYLRRDFNNSCNRIISGVLYVLNSTHFSSQSLKFLVLMSFSNSSFFIFSKLSIPTTFIFGLEIYSVPILHLSDNLLIKILAALFPGYFLPVNYSF